MEHRGVGSGGRLRYDDLHERRGHHGGRHDDRHDDRLYRNRHGHDARHGVGQSPRGGHSDDAVLQLIRVERLQ